MDTVPRPTLADFADFPSLQDAILGALSTGAATAGKANDSSIAFDFAGAARETGFVCGEGASPLLGRHIFVFVCRITH